MSNPMESKPNAYKDIMDTVRIETMEGQNVKSAVDKHCCSVLGAIYDSPGDIGLSCTTSVSLLEKTEGNAFLLIVRGLSQPGRHKVVSYTDSQRWQDCLIQFASDVERERIEWKADEPKRGGNQKATFYDDFVK